MGREGFHAKNLPCTPKVAPKAGGLWNPLFSSPQKSFPGSVLPRNAKPLTRQASPVAAFVMARTRRHAHGRL